MGFPEDMVLACLRASNGNADIAVEFLTNGIPPGMESGTSSSAQSPGRSASGGTLSGLRNHPQFNDLRRLVQSNPAMLQNVLTQIGQQQPELLAEINANQEAFLQMMNEPINEQVQALRSQSSAGGSSGIGGSLDGIPPGMMDGMANPAQMAQLIQNMSPTELNQMATTMGLSPDQLRTTAQMLQQIPPEQLNEYMYVKKRNNALSRQWRPHTLLVFR
jgi:UV excision repair protein RAD23